LKANPNYIHLKRTVKDSRITLLQGGTRSGKTWSVIYYIIFLCDHYKGLEIDIVRDTFTALKASVWKDFKQILVSMGEYDVRKHNRTDHIYNLNNNIINYYGADNPEKIHGRSRDILWVNEAQHINEDTIDQLFPRTKHRIIADYNPALPQDHWLDKYIPDSPPFISTYQDNPHLTSEQIVEIESRKNNAYWWSVYGSGERAQPVGAIFTDWEFGTFDDSLPYNYGMDFGYSVDPSALIKAAVDNKRKVIYLKEELYKAGLTTSSIFDAVAARIQPRDLIVADSAEPRLIDELRTKGLNIMPVVKGPDSVRAGLMLMQDYKLIVEKDSHNLAKELNNYVWHDKKSETPVDKWNHAVDAARYAVYNKLSRPNYGVYAIR